MNCKPGDLAIIIRAPFVPENVGRIVKVLKFVGVDDGGERSDWWRVESGGLPIKGRGGVFVLNGIVPDAYMRPVSGIPDTEEADAKQPIKEVA